LDDRLQQLFAEEREAFDRRPSGKEVALHAVEQRVLLAGLGATAGAPLVPPAPPGATAGVTSAGLAASKGKLAALMALVFSAGFGAGVWVRGAQTPAASVVTLAPSVSAPLPPTMETSATTTAQVPSGQAGQAPPLEAPNKATAVHAASSASAAVAAPSSSSSSSSSLAAERDLIDTARAALSRGRADDALAAVQLHATRYPNGSLAEEREFLAIQALSMAGRKDAANERAARFHQRYPKSIFGSSVDGLLRKGQ
jgi:hypothetical protein